jgi:hypothetical protein
VKTGKTCYSIMSLYCTPLLGSKRLVPFVDFNVVVLEHAAELYQHPARCSVCVSLPPMSVQCSLLSFEPHLPWPELHQGEGFRPCVLPWLADSDRSDPVLFCSMALLHLRFCCPE